MLTIGAISQHSESTLRSFAERALVRGRAEALRGQVSRQIPALGQVDPTRFGIAVATLEGALITVGDSDSSFSLQSLTKLFSLCALLRDEPSAWEHVGWGPSDAGFGSVAELEKHDGRPRNPFVNAGALVVTDRLAHHSGDAAEAVATMMRELSGGCVADDALVAASEAASDHRNRAIAHVLAEHDRLLGGIDTVLAQYFRQCSLTASASTAARSALFLADRRTHDSFLDTATIRRVNAVLLTAGMYGAAGDVAHRVGLPAKSGIGGGVLAVMPGVGALCAWSPPLDLTGNSVGGVAAIEEFARLAGWSVF